MRLFDKTKDKKITELETETKELKERLMLYYDDATKRLEKKLVHAIAKKYNDKKNVKKSKKGT